MKIVKILSDELVQRTQVEEIINFLKKGKVIICPTDTVYGLLADATDKKAVEKIFKIKNRPRTKPLAVFVKDVKMAKKLAEMDKNQENYLKKVWPGRVTVILKSKALSCREQFSASWPRTVLGSELLLGENQTIGLRIPDYKLVNDLLKKFKKPIAQTSANISGKPATTKIKEVLAQFKNRTMRPDLVVNAGNLPKNKPSKIIDLSKGREEALRY